VVDVVALRWFSFALSAWLRERETEALAYLLEENRTLRAQLGNRPLRLTNDQRRRLAVLGHRLGRRRLQDVAIVTPHPNALFMQQMAHTLYLPTMGPSPTTGS